MRKTIFEFIRTAIFGIVIALIVTCFFQPSRVQGTSMEPTVQQDNLVILNKASYWMSLPEYGDIVVFQSNLYTDNGEGKMLIKRIIGIEGDVIEIKNGAIYRNGIALPEDYIYGANPQENMEAIKIEKGHVFVLGDHRDVSLDSRDESIGQVLVSDIVGKVSIRLYPFTEIGPIK